jgi:peroxiredoxin Q/BCP
MTLKIGDPAPAFTLPTDGKGEVSLAALKGRKVIVYFYPKDATSGCTKQACDFRDAFPRFPEGTVIGISKDSVASHDKFKAAQSLPFTLASDLDGAVCEAYGVWVEKSMYGKKYMGIERSTFLIDAAGIIQGIWRKVSVPGHVAEVMAAAAKL